MSPTYGFPHTLDGLDLSPERQIPHFVLTEAMVRTLAPVGINRRWRTGEMLAFYGQRMDHVSVCLSGQYKVLLNSIDGQSHFLRLITAGELFGVPSALAGTPFPTDIVCEVPGETMEIPRISMLDKLREEPDLALSIIKSLATRVTEMFGLMEADLLPTLRARVYQRLQRLAQFNGRADRTGNIELQLTQMDIAHSLNASRPRVQQELKRLEKEGLIRLGYRRITLLQTMDPAP